MKEKHPIAGEPPSVPAVKKPAVSVEARHPAKNDANPQGSGSGPGGPEPTESKPIVKSVVAEHSGNPNKKFIPWDGTHQEQRIGQREYPEQSEFDAKPDESVVRRCIDAQIANSTPVAVPDSKKNKT